MKILHVAPAFYPATYWGGPTYSTLGLCGALASVPGTELRVLTTDTAGPALSERVDVHALPRDLFEGFDVTYCRKVVGVDIAPALLVELWRLVAWTDVVHLTAVYSFPTLPTLAVARLMRKPLVWSPRGALMRWRGSSHLRTKSFWEWVCRLMLDKRASVFHVTSAREEEGTRHRMPGYRVVLVPNGVTVPAARPRVWLPGGVCRLLYVGRLHPIKGIENLIQSLALIKAGTARLNICGTGDAEYVESLKTLAKNLHLDAIIDFSGHVEAEQKVEAFQNADLLVLPSFSENFGTVVVEALADGLPVITSTGTPWARVEQIGCGKWIENSPSSMARAIEAVRTADLQAMGNRGRRWVSENYDWRNSAGEMLDLYSALIGGDPNARR